MLGKKNELNKIAETGRTDQAAVNATIAKLEGIKVKEAH